MHDAIVTNGRLQPGETIIIQGASSGVGIMGLQIAKLKGAQLVIGTSTNDARRARLKEYGADLAIDTKKPNWSEDVLQATGGKGVNVIIDMVSASVANENMKAAAVLGRIINVGRLGGGRGEFDYNLHANKRIAYIGVTHRTRSPISGKRSAPASSRFRSIASSSSMRPRRRRRICAAIRISARS
jgi:NADPH2:quinone reductase